MLLANVAVAERLYGAFPGCALLRNHRPPVEAPLASVAALARQNGLELDITRSAAHFQCCQREKKIPAGLFIALLYLLSACRGYAWLLHARSSKGLHDSLQGCLRKSPMLYGALNQMLTKAMQVGRAGVAWSGMVYICLECCMGVSSPCA